MLIRLSRVFLGGGPKPCKRSQVDRSESVYCLFFFSSLESPAKQKCVHHAAAAAAMVFCDATSFTPSNRWSKENQEAAKLTP